jgi:hypothetical protein
MSRYSLFDRNRLKLDTLAQRGHDLTWINCRSLEPAAEPSLHADLPFVARAMTTARQRHHPVILMVGAHPIKLGLSRFLIDLVERGCISHLATNGAGVIHDFELALVGGTSEDVARWIQVGQFGLWRETGQLNDIVQEAARSGLGLGEAVGRVIHEERFPHADLSLAAACWRAGIPLTCHVSIGSDIIHSLPNCDGAALGRTSYTDFLILAHAIQELEGGVFLNIGSAVTGPEVYLKALSMARNVARQDGQEIRRFTTAVFDLVPLPADWQGGTPAKDQPLYYYRPWKTILVRTVADGGTSYYIQGDHRQTIPTLWQHLTEASEAR